MIRYMERLKHKIISTLAGALLLPSTILHHLNQEYQVLILMCLNADISTNIRALGDDELIINGFQRNLGIRGRERLFVLALGSRGSNEALYLYQTPDIYALPNRIGPVDPRILGGEDRIVKSVHGYLPGIAITQTLSVPSDPKDLLRRCFEESSSLA